jgi:hypothetical protein
VSAPRAPIPTRQAIERFSPTLVEALLTCPLKAAFSQDPTFRRLRRPTPGALLGQAAHRLTEAASSGRFDAHSGPQLRAALEEAWTMEVDTATTRLHQAWTIAPPPPARDWPGYALGRVRLLRRLTGLVERRQGRAAIPAARGQATVTVEQTLEDPTTGLHGRPDRVETLGHHTRVVDLKTGWTQQPEIRDSQRRQLLLYAYLVYRARGRWPQEIAIEDAAGRRATEPVQPEEPMATVNAALQAVQAYNDAVDAGQSPLSLATPSPEACRHCPFRVVCGPFWQATTMEWPQRPGVVGVVTATSSTVGRLEVTAEQPAHWAGSTVTVLGISPAILPRAVGERVGIVDTYSTGQDRELQARWDTQLERWGDTPASSPPAAAATAGQQRLG